MYWVGYVLSAITAESNGEIFLLWPRSLHTICSPASGQTPASLPSAQGPLFLGKEQKPLHCLSRSLWWEAPAYIWPLWLSLAMCSGNWRDFCTRTSVPAKGDEYKLIHQDFPVPQLTLLLPLKSSGLSRVLTPGDDNFLSNILSRKISNIYLKKFCSVNAYIHTWILPLTFAILTL